MKTIGNIRGSLSPRSRSTENRRQDGFATTLGHIAAPVFTLVILGCFLHLVVSTFFDISPVVEIVSGIIGVRWILTALEMVKEKLGVMALAAVVILGYSLKSDQLFSVHLISKMRTEAVVATLVSPLVVLFFAVLIYRVCVRAEETPRPTVTPNQFLSPLLQELEKTLKRTKEIVKVGIIGPRGGEISLTGAVITFPVNTLHEDTEILITMIRSPAKFRPGVFPITPTLRCEPSISFRKPVTIRMRTFCRVVGNKKMPVDILCRRNNRGKRVRLPHLSLVLGKQNFVSFEVEHFSQFLAVFSSVVPINPEEIQYDLFHDVYIHRDTATIVSIFSQHDDTSEHRTDVKSKGFKPLDLIAPPIRVKIGQKVESELTCISPDNTRVSFASSFPSSFILDQEFLDSNEYFIHYKLDPQPIDFDDIMRFRDKLKIVEKGSCLRMWKWKTIGDIFFDVAIRWPIIIDAPQIYVDNSATIGVANQGGGTLHYNTQNADVNVNRSHDPTKGTRSRIRQKSLLP